MMINRLAADHALGIELQLEELVEQRERARVQHRLEDEVNLSEQIAALQAELAEYVESVADLDVPAG